MNAPLQHHPCILILGSEGEGLRWKIQSKADFEIGIEGQRHGHGGVDSLNVSVAAAMLCDAFLKKGQAHMSTSGKKQKESEGENALF